MQFSYKPRYLQTLKRMTHQEKSPVFSASTPTLDFPSKTYPLAAKAYALLVLGMHRSGTSALTRVINLLGAELPERLLPAAAENASGFWESSELVKLHDELLTSAGSCWHDWTALNSAWYTSPAAVELRQRLLSFLRQDFANASLFVIKDPRICRFVPFWLETLQQFQAVPKVLIPVRNPLEVAASLKARNSFIPAKSYLLWLRHVLDAERETRTLARSVITYPALLQNWRSTVDKAAYDLGLQWPRLPSTAQAEIEQFLSLRQRHHMIEDSALGAHPEVVVWVNETYEALLEMARGENNATQQRRLDEITRAFNQAEQAFGPIYADQALALEQQHGKNQCLRAELDKVQANLTERVAANTQLSTTVNTHSTHIKQLSQAVAKRDQRIEKLIQQLSNLQRCLSERLQERNHISQELDKRTLVAEELSHRLAHRDYRLRQLDDNLTRVYQSLQQRMAELEQQRNLTEQLANTVSLRATALEQTTQALTASESMLARERTQTNRLHQRVLELTAQNRQLQQLSSETAAVQHQLQTIRHSLAWGFAAPVRWISRTLRWPLRVLYGAFTLQLRQQINHLRHIRLIRASGLFDDCFYLAHNPDVVQSGVDPLWHFLSCGASQGRDPNPLFATAYYLSTYPDVAKSRFNPLSHFIRFGAFQGYNPHPLFHTRYYLSENPEVAKAGINPLAHYLQEATATNPYNPNPVFNTSYYVAQNLDITLSGINPLIHYLTQDLTQKTKPHPLFDPDYYLNTNPDVAKAKINPLLHFLGHGGFEGRDPNPIFDSSYYLDSNPDVQKKGINPLIHFIRFGARERRNPSVLFDVDYYLNLNPDVEKSGSNPLEHFLLQGGYEGRKPIPLFDPLYYLNQYPDVARERLNPLVHFVTHGGFEGRNPHPLFETRFYLTSNPDIARNKENPLIHFLAFGGQEKRNPNPLFDVTYYLNSNPDVEISNINPLVHFLEWGIREGRNPNPLLDVVYYLETNPDIAPESINPLTHFLTCGGFEGRKPSPDFDPAYYLKVNPDVAAAGKHPLAHYLNYGKKEGRRATPQSALHDTDLFLPAKPARAMNIPVGLVIDIIIPIYKGMTETRRCLTSVLNAQCQIRFRVIVVNDASPEIEINDYLNKLRDDRVVVLENEKNLGFVESVNLGMAYAATRDVVLLNSDTEVADGWLDRLVQHAYSADDVGTVTPFSNNATICSYPRLAESNELPPHETVVSLNKAFHAANAGQSVDLPTAIGFCMYIRRRCLDQIGLFDAVSFGKGYGEENDFCLKATALGWRHLLAADTFVFHQGEVSFQSSASLAKQNAMHIIRSKYPHYVPTVMDFIQCDPVKPLRIAATAARYRHSGLPVVLFVSHNLGGGTTKHSDNLAKENRERANFLLLKPIPDETGAAKFELTSMDGDDAVQLALATVDFDFLIALLKSFGVSQVHVHHVLGMPIDVKELVHRLQVPFDFTVHDYFSICPQINLISTDDHYCQEPDAAGCNRCIAALPSYGAHDIDVWRKSHEWLFLQAERVICPSEDTANRCLKYYPEANIITVPHEHPSRYQRSFVNLISLDKDEDLRIAVLGAIGISKGVKVIISCAQRIALMGLPLEIHLIGYAGLPLPLAPETPLYQTGAYKDEQLSGLIEEVNPHVIWFPAQWPETYNYALSAALASARPVIIPNLGAFPERVNHRPWSWIVDWDASPIQLTKTLMQIRDHYLQKNAFSKKIQIMNAIGSGEQQEFYLKNYIIKNNIIKNNIVKSNVQSARDKSVLSKQVSHK